MRDQINTLIEQRDYAALSPVLDGEDIQRIRTTARQIALTCQDHDELLACLEKLAISDPVPLQQLACQLVPHVYAVRRKKAMGVLSQLVESADWTIRDAACVVTGRLLREDFHLTLS